MRVSVAKVAVELSVTAQNLLHEDDFNSMTLRLR